jgi:hypothetical protein
LRCLVSWLEAEDETWATAQAIASIHCSNVTWSHGPIKYGIPVVYQQTCP